MWIKNPAPRAPIQIGLVPYGCERFPQHSEFPFECLLSQKLARGIPKDLTCTSPSFVYINFACVVHPLISGPDLYLACNDFEKQGYSCLQTLIDLWARGLHMHIFGLHFNIHMNEFYSWNIFCQYLGRTQALFAISFLPVETAVTACLGCLLPFTKARQEIIKRYLRTVFIMPLAKDTNFCGWGTIIALSKSFIRSLAQTLVLIMLRIKATKWLSKLHGNKLAWIKLCLSTLVWTLKQRAGINTSLDINCNFSCKINVNYTMQFLCDPGVVI